MNESNIIEILGLFILIYPLGMSIIWTTGTLYYYFRHEIKPTYTNKELPFCTILIPAYNEMENIHDIIDRMHKLNYPNYEIIVINDGSKDATVEVVESILYEYPKLRFVNNEINKGKAHALYLGLLASKGEYIVGVDADSYLENDALIHLIAPMLAENDGLNVGAVTGNPRVRNRTNLLAKLQTAEYSSVVGMIKRTQQLSSSCMTVSGVCVAYRKKALIDCGLWDKDMIAEDIAVTWKLHDRKWRIVYNPFAICWMLVPTKIDSLFKQRVRWAQGGVEVLFRHLFKTIKRLDFRNLTLLGEQILGIIWAFLYVLSIPFIIVSLLNGDASFFTYQVKVLLLVSIFNYLVAFFVEKKYDKQLFRIYPWVIWYPLLYWLFNVIVLVTGFYKVVINTLSDSKTKHATWESPDRGEIISNGVSKEGNIVEMGGSKKHKFIALPITLIIWAYILLALIKFIQKMYYSIFVSSQTVLYSIMTHTEPEYFIFIYIVAIVGIIGVYLYHLLVPFPVLQKHHIKEDSDKKLEEIFGIEDIKVYQNRKKITFRGNNETTNNEYSIV